MQDVAPIKNTYSRMGFYYAYFDTSFSKIKRSEHFFKGIETSVWKEYYLNGNLKYEGSSTPIMVAKSNSDPNIIWVINVQNLKDTFKIIESFNVMDSIKRLTQFNYYPRYESSGYMLPDFYS